MALSTVNYIGDAELLAELARRKQELFELRFKIATGALENTSKLANEKRMVARILTELRAREIAAAEQVDAK